ncbi:fibronectin type III domain-containing protein [Limnovirga soli]|uniref:Fibronectin type-III domain-containing protein n=1 Tax=Limnovirga soli TaxID=2656915 RepID=A0A8J8FCG0_9BACT|nr:fibronectin type III domain-containing protein [Limnovirga soli]NNV54942.1 hypothetical protein [Limnovirga soli]
MSQVKLGFYALSIPDKILKARNIVTLMTGNAAFTTPNPALATVTTAANELETAFNDAADGGRTKTAIRDSKEAELDALMAQLSAYVQEISEGDALIILSSGMEVRAEKTPPQDLPAPQGLEAITGDNEGEIVLRWKRVDKSKAYLFQKSADGATGWENIITTSTKAKALLSGLPTATKMWFRVCAVGSRGNSPWSDACRGLVA